MALSTELGTNLIISATSEKALAASNTIPLLIKESAKDDFVVQPVTLKAVDQDPLPGTLLTPGSKVIVYFEDTDSMMIDIYEGAHADYAGKRAKDIVEMANNDDAVKQIVEAAKATKDLTPEEEIIMSTFFKETVGLDMDETDATKNTESAYTVLLVSFGLMM